MNVLWTLLGVVVILIGLADVFLTVLHYESRGLFTARVYRLVWRAVHRATMPLSQRRRSIVISAGGPGLVVLTLAGWLVTQIVGFALVFLPGVESAAAFTRSGHTPAPLVSLYFATATLASLSFSDVEPRSLPYHAVAAVETLVGLTILTLALTYVLNFYGALQQHGQRATRLRHRMPEPGNPRSLLASHFPDGVPTGISELVRDLHEMMTAQSEAIRRYPVIYYFHSRTPYRSLPYLFWVIGAVGAALRWGLPSSHQAARDPWLPGLLEGYDDVVGQMRKRFVTSQVIDEPAETTDRDTFARAERDGTAQGLLREFLELEDFMRTLAHVPPGGDLPDRYERYCAWSAFVSGGRAFISAASDDLGLPEEALRDKPHARLF